MSVCFTFFFFFITVPSTKEIEELLSLSKWKQIVGGGETVGTPQKTNKNQTSFDV